MVVAAAFLILGCIISYVSGQSVTSVVQFTEVNDCKAGSDSSDLVVRFFNTATLTCEACSGNSTVLQQSANGFSCECRPGYRHVTNFGGKEVTCALCPDAVSDDGWECVTCPGSSINPNTKKCEPCIQDTDITALRTLDGSLYTPAAAAVQCLPCQGVTQPDDDRDRCERCSYTLSIPGSTTSGCTCASTHTKLKGICFPNTEIPQPVASLFLIPLENGNDIRSYYLQENVEADYIMCKTYRNLTACQSLANMCVLVLYNGGFLGQAQSVASNPCSLFQSLRDVVYLNLKPPIFVGDDADNEIESDEIPTQFTVDPVVQIPFQVGAYSLGGIFEGYQAMRGGFLQLCEASESTLNAAFTFGTYYSQSCSISALSLWDQVKYPLKFYEIYMNYTDRIGNDNIYRIPVKIQNLRDFRGSQVNTETIRDWVLTRRFFLVDSLATRTAAGQDAPFVRYTKSIHLKIELSPDTADGEIYVPYFEIEYDDISRELAEAGNKVEVSFQVSYEKSQSDYTRNFQIATGTISSLGVLYAGFRTYVWSRRAGRLTIDFPTLANFIFYLFSSLANCFFVVTFGIAFYFFIFYKRQNVMYIVLLEGQAYEEWLALFASAFTLKALAVLHMIVMQCSADIFLIDWERPKGQSDQSGDGKKSGSSVSIWRTYFVANEWNEIQTKRKINRVFQVFAVVFFLVVVGFEDTTTKDPNGTVNKGSDVYMSEKSEMFRVALAATVYLLVAVVQIIFFLFVYERFITDDIREFVDLCSMSNVSVFVMANGEFGYYIHGRSVHGRSDVNMREMFDMIKREEDDLVGQRGLVPNTEPQTFMMAIPKRLRQKYETVYMPVQLENATAAGRAEQGKSRDKSLEAYGTLNKFLCAFIDHSLRDVDYVVKEKNFLEKILDTEFLELTDKGIFYNDNGHSFDNVLFYGNELMLIVFDTLFFCIVDLIAQDYVLAGIITYLATELICLARETAGKKNLAKKTLVDERFLI